MFRAIGLVILLLAVRFLMPVVFDGLKDTLVQFFGLLQGTMASSQNILHVALPTLGM